MIFWTRSIRRRYKLLATILGHSSSNFRITVFLWTFIATTMKITATPALKIIYVRKLQASSPDTKLRSYSRVLQITLLFEREIPVSPCEVTAAYLKIIHQSDWLLLFARVATTDQMCLFGNFHTVSQSETHWWPLLFWLRRCAIWVTFVLIYQTHQKVVIPDFNKPSYQLLQVNSLRPSDAYMRR